MLERVVLQNLRQTFYKIMGIAQPQKLHRLDHRLTEIERNILAWAKKVEETPLPVHKRVLLADTETTSFDILREAIPEDLELKMIRDWNQLFREVRKAEVPLIVMDLALLGQEGVGNIRKLKARHPEIRVVALASYLSEALAQAMPDGLHLSGILQKPLDLQQVKESLGRHLPS
jgi:ActR/RegA family two-component response regulator